MMIQTIKLLINVVMHVEVTGYLLQELKLEKYTCPIILLSCPDFRAGGQMYRLQDSHRHEDGQRNSGHPAGLR